MIRAIKRIVTGMPVVGTYLSQFSPERFKTSADYWERRYQKGEDSGPGSYNRLAEFKASFLNEFVAKNEIASVIEFGSGDGSQLKLAHYPNYIGVDVSAKAVEICRSIFSGDASKRFLQLDAIKPGTSADLAVSLDVVYHLVEDSVFEMYMRQLFGCAVRFVILYSSNLDQDSPIKHMRHRQFTRWVEQNEPNWYLQSTVKNPYPFDPADPANTSFADFYVFASRKLSDS